MDPWWNPAVEDQASDRAHRIGQQRPVTIYRLVAKDTIEERILKLHAKKRDLADACSKEVGQPSTLGHWVIFISILRETIAPDFVVNPEPNFRNLQGGVALEFGFSLSSNDNFNGQVWNRFTFFKAVGFIGLGTGRFGHLNTEIFKTDKSDELLQHIHFQQIAKVPRDQAM
jgi:hypothetical protein